MIDSISTESLAARIGAPLGIENIGFCLVVDNCGRGCTHCPANGLGLRPTTAPIGDVRDRLRRIRAALPGTDFASHRVVHPWAVGDVLDYRFTDGGILYDAVDVATAWTDVLGQPLYLVTNGSIGSPGRRQTMTRIGHYPELFSQVKLTVTPHDPRFRLPRYVANMAFDVATLWRHSGRPTHRLEAGPGQTWFRINVKANEQDRPEVRAMLGRILDLAGLPPATIRSMLAGEDPRLAYKHVYDLRASTDQPLTTGAIDLGVPGLRYHSQPVRDQYQLGFRPGGEAFLADMAAFRQLNLVDEDGLPVTFNQFVPILV